MSDPRATPQNATLPVPCTEDVLRARRHALAIDDNPDSFFIVDLQGRFLDVNPAFCKLLGYERGQLLDMTLTQIEENLAANVRQRLLWTCHDGHMHYETRHKAASGGLIDLEIASKYAELDGEGFIYAFVRDLREQRRAQSDAKRVTYYLQLLLNSAGEGIYSVDLDGRCTFINRAGLQLLGYARHELMGQAMHSLIHATQPQGPVAWEDSAIQAVLSGGRGTRVNDEVIWRKNASSFAAEYSSYPIMEKGRIAGAVVVFRDITESRSMAMQLEYLAIHDALTGLANRRQFQMRMDEALSRASHEGLHHVLMFIDLDQFKVINDTSGHAAGDMFLRTLADAFKGLIRQGDTLARLGGDEFGLLLEECDLDDGLELASTIRDTVRDFRFSWEGSEFSVGVSIGVVPMSGESPSVAALLSAADAACYSAKDSGHNRVRVYRPNDTALMRRQGDMRWIAQIHQALKEDRLQLYYQILQPISGAKDAGVHMEILLKMVDLKGKIIPPGAFMPAAERAGLTTEIDRWVVSRVFDWLTEHHDGGRALGLCSINLSGHSLGDKHFLEFLLGEFERNPVKPRHVCFEVTETAAIANLNNANRLFTTLSKMGCRFALDDFGTGMSSYGYLKTLPVEYLKIDGSFVKDIVTNPVDLAMVKSINDIGHVMGKKTIAEFVESEAILEKLKALRVDYAQGYFINREAPIAEFTLGKK